MKRDVIIVLQGGTIQGVFSVGVLATLQKHNLYPRVHSIYGVSSGAHNAAYFLSGNIDVGAHIYYDYLLHRRSFLQHLSPRIVCKKLWDLYIHGKSFDIIDLAYIEDLERNILKLDLEKIKNSPINFYVRVFNNKTLRTEYLDAKENTISKLIASSKVPPYAYSKTDTGQYYDGGIMPTKDFLRNVVRKHTDKKIIYIFNDKKTHRRVTKNILIDFMDIAFKLRYLGIGYALKHLFNIYSYTYVRDLKKYKNVICVYDETGNSKREKSKRKIEDAYEFGRQRGKYILEKLKELDKILPNTEKTQ